MKTSTMLKQAKALLWNGRGDDYGVIKTICHAVRHVEERVGTDAAEATSAGVRAEIMARLDPHWSVTAWLKANVGKFTPAQRREIGFTHSHPLARTVQAYRQRWLDALIAEYAARGD